MAKPEYSDEDLLHGCLVHHKFYGTPTGLNQGLCGEKPVNNHLSCNVAYLHTDGNSDITEQQKLQFQRPQKVELLKRNTFT